MNEYTKQELEEAKTALASTLHKCEKMQESGRLQSANKRKYTISARHVLAALSLSYRES